MTGRMCSSGDGQERRNRNPGTVTGRMCSSGDGQERSGTQLKKERGQKKRSWRRRVVHDGKRKGKMFIDGQKRREILFEE